MLVNLVVHPEVYLCKDSLSRLLETQCELLQVALLIAKMRLNNKNNNMMLITLLINWGGFVLKMGQKFRF